MGVLDTFSLKGKVAVVTGGAGKYGRQITLALGEAHAETYIASRNVEASEVVAREYRDAGHRVKALYLDQGDEGSILALRDEILRQSGRVDILVNNAITQYKQAWGDDAGLFDKSMHINGTGIFMMTRAFGDLMAEQGSGSIINIASMFGMVGPDMNSYEGEFRKNLPSPDYHFLKGGIINFTRYTASYYGARSVRCNCISPGGMQSTKKPDRCKTIEQWKWEEERKNKKRPLGRGASETDLKGIIVFLASDASSYLTGTNIPVDGGYTAI